MGCNSSTSKQQSVSPTHRSEKKKRRKSQRGDGSVSQQTGAITPTPTQTPPPAPPSEIKSDPPLQPVRIEVDSSHSPPDNPLKSRPPADTHLSPSSPEPHGRNHRQKRGPTDDEPRHPYLTRHRARGIRRWVDEGDSVGLIDPQDTDAQAGKEIEMTLLAASSFSSDNTSSMSMSSPGNPSFSTSGNMALGHQTRLATQFTRTVSTSSAMSSEDGSDGGIVKSRFLQ